MIGGQAADKLAEGQNVDLPTLEYISVNKTGQLIKASCVAGAIVGKASPSVLKRITRFGEHLGLAFQMVDDIMDGDGFLRILSRRKVFDDAQSLIEKARDQLAILEARGETLKEIATYIVDRGKVDKA